MLSGVRTVQAAKQRPGLDLGQTTVIGGKNACAGGWGCPATPQCALPICSLRLASNEVLATYCTRSVHYVPGQ